MSAYQDQTDPLSQTLAPSRQLKPQSGKSAYLIDEREAKYLFYLRESQGDDFYALTQAGYHPKDANAARSQAYDIRKRINEQADARSVFNAAGMGLVEWTLALDWLMHQDAKWRAVTIKSWGLAIGAYAQQIGAQGATINVSLLQHQEGHGTQAGLVQVTVDARKALPEPHHEP